MFTCTELHARAHQEGPAILHNINTAFAPGKLNAIVGPSGCGKTTLIRTLLRLTRSEGEVTFCGQAVGHPTQLAGRCGLVPQFSVAHPHLTVQESLDYALKLTAQAPGPEREARVLAVLKLIGMSEHAAKPVSTLSGGQLRRLGLGLELVGDPDCLICDEVTSGLDPLSEDQILTLLKNLSRDHGKTFICIIHNLARLPDFDQIHVLYEGRLVFAGSYPELCAWFSLKDPLKLYHVLATRSAGDWAKLWGKEGLRREVPRDSSPPPREGLPSRRGRGGADSLRAIPGPLPQLVTLLKRRFLLLSRDTGYLWLLLALTFGFPCMVVIFALKGLPQIEGLALERSISYLDELQQNLRYQMEAAETASLVTGLILFQVVLLALMGANNGAREIASVRTIMDKEIFSGVSPWAYAASKLLFTGLLAALQGIWMALFVKIICQFPGPLLSPLLILAAACMAMTWVCLGISALCASSEKASLLSIYLVGFQLPLSGIVLALPDTLVWALRPFINAYWAWAGYFSSMKNYQLYDAYRMQESGWIPDTAIAAAVLSLQALCGAAMVFYGCQRRSS